MTKRIPCSSLLTLMLFLVAGVCKAQCDPETGVCVPSPPAGVVGDYNFDGIVSHADYTVLGDTFGQFGPNLAADGNLDGIVDQADFEVYRANYGIVPNTGTPVAPFTIVASPTVDGDTRWVLSLPYITSLSAHVNIKVRDSSNPSLHRTFLQIAASSPLQDVPGVLTNSASANNGYIREGIYVPVTEITDTDVFVGLGTNLGQPITGGNHTFLTLISNGLQGTTLTLEGAFGYQATDHRIQQSASFGSFDAGASPANPLLPNVPNPGNFNFQNVPSGRWFDPPAVAGFEYIMESASLFTAIRDFPPGFASPFQVAAEGSVLGMFGPGQPVDFVQLLGHGVDRFTVSGISPSVDAEDPQGFPLRITFNTPFASFRMSAIPEPGLGALLFTAALVAGPGIGARRTKKTKGQLAGSLPDDSHKKWL
jgi:hypothetical protein